MPRFKKIFRNRCGTCLYWDGDRKLLKRQFKDTINHPCLEMETYMDSTSSDAIVGECLLLGGKQGANTPALSTKVFVEGVFGCIEYKFTR